MTQIIYYDYEDEQFDGNGWNIVGDGEAVALRFPTLREARLWCIYNGYEFTIEKVLA